MIGQRILDLFIRKIKFYRIGKTTTSVGNIIKFYGSQAGVETLSAKVMKSKM